jgi:hypothetical protein
MYVASASPAADIPTPANPKYTYTIVSTNIIITILSRAAARHGSMTRRYITCPIFLVRILTLSHPHIHPHTHSPTRTLTSTPIPTLPPNPPRTFSPPFNPPRVFAAQKYARTIFLKNRKLHSNQNLRITKISRQKHDRANHSHKFTPYFL